MRIGHHLESPSLMTTNQGLTLRATVAADQHYKDGCVKKRNVCLLHITLPTQPIFLSRSAFNVFIYDFPHV